MSFFRSETVDRFKLYLPRESAWSIMNKLGEQQLIHIIPSKSNDIIRHFTVQVRRIQEALHKLQKLEHVLISKKMDSNINYIDKVKMNDIFTLFQSLQNEENSRNQANQANIVIQNVDELWEYYNELNKRIQMLDKQIQYSRQSIAILLTGQKQYGKSFFSNDRQRIKSYEQINFYSVNKIHFKAGVLKKSDELRFKRTVFRISKGNCLIMTKNLSEIFQDSQPYQKERVVFFVIYPSNSNEAYFERKITKLISTFCERNFDHYLSQQNSFDQVLQQMNKTYNEALSLKKMCENQMDSFLYQKLLQRVNKKVMSTGKVRKHHYLKLYLLKEKQIYENLNQMDIYSHFFQGQIFIRKQHVTKVQQLLSQGNILKELPPGNIVPIASSEKYPSSFVLNDYTRPAQQIVQTYGVPRYKQINPSLYTTVTFPFLFGVMFGDIGHGIILLLVGSLLVLKTQEIRKYNNLILNMLIPYRYLIALMGFFATYCGFIYNDFLSISLNLLGSCYDVQNSTQKEIIDRLSSNCTYPIGLDPVWSVAQNSLNFTNSLKMKIAVIIGVIHMTLGVCLKALNDIYFKNYKEVIFVFTSQFLFLLGLFGYMDLLIIYKWLVPWGVQRQPSLAPSIISQMIAIPLSMGSTQGKPLWDKHSQESLQYFLLIIAGISVPMMLFPVPLMKIFKIQRRKSTNDKKIKKPGKKYANASDIQNDITQMLMNKEQSYYSHNQEQLHIKSEIDQEESASQIFVHQIIQTIQYVLGCVSNTASYLRLWALSLAHSQLSEVFFQKTVQNSLQSGWSGIFQNIIGFAILASVTVGIMLLMDTMECFLHTLRLHWVEFQNKFYKGDGFSFKNYNFQSEINEYLRKNSL